MDSTVFLQRYFLPIYKSGSEMVNYFEQDNAITKIVHKVVNVDIFDTLRVDPVLEDSDLAGLVGLGFSRKFRNGFFFLEFETMTMVEYFSAEKSVQSGITRKNAIRSNGRMETFFDTSFNNLVSSLFFIKIEIISWQRWSNTFEHLSICITIAHITTYIFDYSITSIFLDMIVDPSDQNIFIS